MDIDMRYMNTNEVLINLFTIENGILKVLLIRRNMDPYRGYWMLPSSLLLADETMRHCADEALYEWIGIKSVYTEHCNVYSELERIPVQRVIGNSMVGIIDSKGFELTREPRDEEIEWFPASQIPKMVYDHKEIIEDAVTYTRRRLNSFESLKKLFPSDFTLPELQQTFEQIIGSSLDRRNFRKKIMNLDVLEDTGYKNEDTNGRPATLYRFKNDINKDIVYQ